MDSNTKLYVFAKFEIALIFMFMFFIAISSFIFGMQVGEGRMCQDAGTEAMKSVVAEKVQLLSKEEEMVETIISESDKKEDDKVYEEIDNRLKEEFNRPEVEGREGTGSGQTTSVSTINGIGETKVDNTKEVIPKTIDEVEKAAISEVPITPDNVSDEYSGKYTIQLGSHQSMKEAEEFAEGFRVRGYNPIINQINQAKSGIWYRVSLGAFKSASEAKNYIIKENTLFQGEDYFIRKFE